MGSLGLPRVPSSHGIKSPLPRDPLGSQGSPPMGSLGLPRVPPMGSLGLPSVPLPWDPLCSQGFPPMGSLGLPRVPELITCMRAVRHVWHRGRFTTEPPNSQAVRTARLPWKERMRAIEESLEKSDTMWQSRLLEMEERRVRQQKELEEQRQKERMERDRELERRHDERYPAQLWLAVAWVHRWHAPDLYWSISGKKRIGKIWLFIKKCFFGNSG
jgi:hypothetical protein